MRASLATLLLLTGFASAEIRLPSPSTGVIDGRDATYVWPARFRGNEAYDLQPIDDCKVHLSQRRDLNSGSVHPCGKWFVPKLGKHIYWIEGPDFISPEPLLMQYAAALSTGSGRGMVAPVVPSGFVRLAGAAPVKGAALRLISLETEFYAPRTAVFDRPVRDALRPAAMPHGKVLAGIFDLETGDAIALARPVTVRAGETVSVSPSSPANDSDVFVVLARALDQQGNLRVLLEDEGGKRPPDVSLPMRNAVYAVWYGARGQTATITVDSPTLTIPPATITLRPQRVSTFRGELKTKPSLAISVRAPDGVFEKMEVAVEGNELIARKPIDRELRIDGMPSEPVKVTLTADHWELTKEIDLTDGEDAEVEFLLEPIILRGTVYLGRERTRASLGFTYGIREPTTVDTNERGEYEAVFWQPGLYSASIHPATGSAFNDPAVPVEESGTVDFRIPDNRISARVVDARTGRGIGGAIVGVQNDAEHHHVGAMTTGRRFAADDDGRLALPRLWAGKASVEASAAGYAPSEPQRLDVDETTKRELTFTLKALDARKTTIVLSDGRPANGAEAAIVALDRIVWRGTADGEGTLDVVTQGVSGILIVRHPQAASLVRPLANLGERLVLGPADSAPLTLRTARFSLVTVWIDSVRLTDQAAAFATWSDVAMTDANGVWTGRNLPLADVRVLATRRMTPAQIATGAFDALAKVIAFPREPGRNVDIPAVE